MIAKAKGMQKRTALLLLLAQYGNRQQKTEVENDSETAAVVEMRIKHLEKR